MSELALRSTRAYVVAQVGRDVVGYAGLMMSLNDGHVTTIAVDPRGTATAIGTRLLLALAREAIARGATALTLEVRLSQQRRAGAVPPVRVRAGRRPQGLLRRHQRGRARDVGARGRPPEYAELLGRHRTAACRARRCTSDRSPGDDAHPRHRDVVRRDRGRGRRRRPHRALVGGVEPGRPARRASAASCPRSRAGRTSSCSTPSSREALVEAGVDARATSTRSPRCTVPGWRARCSSA